MKLKTHKIILFFTLLITCNVFCQAIANPLGEKTTLTTPKVIAFDRKDFKADPQFWTMCENEDGTLIFGNNDGALVYDGEHWQKIFLPNNSSIRSLLKTDDGKIYVGGYNEIGTINKDKYGNYFYKSLLEKYHLENKNLENLWQIHQIKKQIIYRSFTELIIISGNRINQIPANKSFIYSQKINDNYYVQDSNYGIYKLNTSSNTLNLIYDSKSILNEDIACILPTPNVNVITIITKSGIVYSGDIVTKVIQRKITLFDLNQKDQVNYGIVSDHNNYLIGTSSSNVIKITSSGKILRGNKLFPGLSNKTIHFLFETKNHDIWVLQNNGLSLLDFNSPFVSLFDQSSVYDILAKKNELYIATNNGVYYSNFNNPNENSLFHFKKIEELQGQTWAVQEFDNDIIISHDTGLYKFNNGSVQKISTQNGFWKITKIKNKEGLYLGSNYYGLFLIEKKGNNWSIKNKINGFDESTRDIIADYEPNTYWICHGYKGVYRIHINANYSRIDVVDHYTNKNGFKSKYNINAFYWNNKIVFTTNTGIYTYNNTTNKFELYAPLNLILDPSINTRKIMQANNKTWFVQDDEVGYFENQNPKQYKDLFINLKGSFNRGMESIYPINNNKILFGTNMGLILYNIKKNQNQENVPTVISKISYTQNQESNFKETNSKNTTIQFPNETDVIRFEFAAPKMISSAEINYSYKLDNIDGNWSSWQSTPYKEYTHLRPGKYTFIVKSRNLAGVIGKENLLEFTILPKWYQTNFALFIYFILTALTIYFLVRYVKRKILFERNKSQIEIQKTQQLLELELEKLKLKQDKEEIHKDKLTLEGNILDKSKELANYTLLLSQKKNTFQEIYNDLKQLRIVLKSDEARSKVTEIFQKLNQQKIGEEYMEIFDVNFEKVNHDFFEKLKKLDPTITKRELRLCAFVKMDMTNKEISPLLNISQRGVESARYRVRKKLNVKYEDNFVSFLESISQDIQN